MGVLLRHGDTFMVAQFADKSSELAWIVLGIWEGPWTAGGAHEGRTYVQTEGIRGRREQDRMISPCW